jgi:maltooligosyltrehalose trehalohydrolase
VGRLKAAAALVFTSPFLPMIFQGEEWAASTPFLYFCNHADPALAEKVRQGRRAEFPVFSSNPEQIPDPQAEETFLRSKLIWEEVGSPGHADLLDWHKRLIRLRKSNPELCDGRMESVRARCDETTRCLMVERGEWTVVCNLGPESLKTKLGDGAHEIAMASQAGIMEEPPMITLPPDSVAILGPHRS